MSNVQMITVPVRCLTLLAAVSAHPLSAVPALAPGGCCCNSLSLLLPPQVPVEVNTDLLKQLLDMGFSEARAARGLHFSGNSTLEGAINWLAEHEGDEDINHPLLVPKVWQQADNKFTHGQACSARVAGSQFVLDGTAAPAYTCLRTCQCC